MSDEFLNTVNSTQKTFGHNKFQIEIDKLKAELKQSESISNQKDIKIKLFNQTLSNLGDQLKQKDIYISQLETNLNILENKEHKEINKLTNIIDKSDCCMKEVEKEKENLHQDLCNIKDTLHKKISECEKYQIHCKDNFKEINALKEQLIKNTNTIDKLSTENILLTQKLSSKSNIADNSGKEINGLKEHIQFYKSQVDELKSQLIQTQTQLELMTSPPEHIIETNQTIGVVRKRNKDAKRRK